MRVMPSGVADAASSHRGVVLLANGNTPPGGIITNTPRGAHCRGDRRQAGITVEQAVVGAGMGRDGARDFMQAACDRYGKAHREHARAPRAGRRLSASYTCGMRGTAPPRRRAL